MSLPGIEIEFKNGSVNQVVPSPDGCFGLVAMAMAITGTFEHERAYVVKNMQDVDSLGIIDDVDNHRLYKFLDEFYEEGGSGQELWIMAFPKTDQVSDWFVKTGGKAPVEKLLDAANGKLRGLLVLMNPDIGYTPIIINGIDADIVLAKSKAQTLLDDYTKTKYAPAFCILEGYAFDGDHVQLGDLTEESNNRVGILIGDSESRAGDTLSQGAALGVLAGRLAKNPVQRNIGRVASGPLKPLEIYIKDEPVEQYDVESLHDKGYITFTTHVGKSGYFFSDDPLATEVSDDYHYLTMRRVIDKAYRIAYGTLLDFLLDDVQLTREGTVSPIYAKNMEGRVIGAIYSQMTVNDELSADLTDAADKGVKCEVDLTNNVASTSKLKVTILVQPKGCARWIEVPLGLMPVE